MESRLKGCFSHKSDDWATPKALYAYFCSDLNCFDPCPLNSSFDGLALDWFVYPRLFINPPYSNIWPFVKKSLCVVENSDNLVYLLVPVRSDTYWWKSIIDSFHFRIWFFRGRLKFGDGSASAPFPSALIILHRSFSPSVVCGTLEEFLDA